MTENRYLILYYGIVQLFLESENLTMQDRKLDFYLKLWYSTKIFSYLSTLQKLFSNDSNEAAKRRLNFESLPSTVESSVPSPCKSFDQL